LFAIIGVIGNSLISHEKSLPILVWLPLDYHQQQTFEKISASDSRVVKAVNDESSGMHRILVECINQQEGYS
jgi:hypothetical protein